MTKISYRPLLRVVGSALLFAGLGSLGTGVYAASIAFVQSASRSQTSGQTASSAFTGSVTSGNLLIVSVFVDPGAIVAVTDSQGSSFTQVAHQPVANDHDADVLVATVGSSGADTINVNAGSGKNLYAFSIHEYSGVTPVVDALTTAQGDSAAAATGNLTTATPNDLVFVWFTNGSNFRNEDFPSLTSGYTRREMPGTGTTKCYSFANCIQSADLFTTTTLTTNVASTLNVSDIWSATAIAFRSSSSSGSDSTPPSVPANLRVTGTTSSTASLAWSASTDNVGVAGYKIFRAGSSVGNTSMTSHTDIGLTPSTAYSYTVSAFDSAGNTSAPSSPVVATTQSAPPTITSFSANPATITSGQQSTLSWSVSGATSLSLDNGIGDGTGTTSIAVKPTATTTYTLTASNNLGSNTSQTTVRVSPDTAPPTVSITVPASGATVSSSVSLSATASDNVAVASVAFSVDGTAIATDTSSPYNATWNSMTVSNGSHSVTGTATDTSGNQASASVSITVNNSSSQRIAFIQSASKSQTSGQSAGVAFKGSVTAGNLLIVSVFVDPGAVVAVTDSRGSSFTQVAHQPVTNDHDADVLVATVGTSGADSITVNAGSGKNVYAFAIHEYSGVTPFVDGVATAQGNSAAPGTGNLTTATPNDLVFVWFTNGSNFRNENFPSLASGYTPREMSGNGTKKCYSFANCVQSADMFTTTTLTTNVTATLNVSDIWSAMVIAFKGGSSSGSDSTPPSVPENLHVTGTTTSTASLAWSMSTDDVGVAGYKIFRAGVQIGTTSALSYTDTGLAISTSYSYTVSAYDAAGNTSAPSAAVVATTQSTVDTIAPSVPTGLQSTGVTSSSATITWNASQDNVGVAGYKVFRNDALVGATAQTTYTDASLASSTTYNYTVAAYDAAGNVSGTVSPELAVTTLSAAGNTYPLKASANRRYLVDQNNVPFLLMGDSPQVMIGKLTPAEMATFMTDRQSLGFNAIEVMAVCATLGGCPANAAAVDGTMPFTSGSSPSNFDLSTPNNAYFAELDALINLAAAHNLVVFLDPIETGTWLSTLENNGATKAFNFGAYLGNRYKNFPNIVWYSGNDFQSWNSNSNDNNLVHQVMAGIASADLNHLQSIELNYNFSYANQDTATLSSVLTLNQAYTYGGTYDEVLQAYNSSPTLPVFMGESNYEYENAAGGLPGPANAFNLRKQEYWTVTSGATGSFYGNGHTWQFQADWMSFLDSPGARQVAYLNTFFGALPWWQMVPDAGHSVVTAGYGTATPTDLKAPAINNYSTTLWKTDGSVAAVYVAGNSSPPGSTTLTVNMAKFSGPVTAKWFDPSNGTYSTISGSPFSNSGSMRFTTPGNNHDGDPDWLLLLQVGI